MNCLELRKYIEKNITKEEALELFNLKKSELPYLFAVANEIREKYLNDNFETCTITNAKFGNCPEDCKFCAQGMNCKVDNGNFPVKDKDILKEEFITADNNKSLRFGIVTSGRKMKLGTKDFNEIINGVKNIISTNKNAKICCSLGLLGKEELTALKEAGVARYHCNIQTSPKKYGTFAATTHSIEDRVRTVKEAQEVGLEVCCGGIIGMGESFEDRVDMAMFLKELNVDGIPLNILIPIKGTPYEKRETLSASEILKTIAIFRIILKDKNIKIAAGRESILKDFMGNAFLSGANGMLIGGYLTAKGRGIEEDNNFIKNLNKFF